MYLEDIEDTILAKANDFSSNSIKDLYLKRAVIAHHIFELESQKKTLGNLISPLIGYVSLMISFLVFCRDSIEVNSSAVLKTHIYDMNGFAVIIATICIFQVVVWCYCWYLNKSCIKYNLELEILDNIINCRMNLR